jgi:polyferredoxin
MIIQQNRELVQSYYFHHSYSNILVVLAFIILISVGLIAAILLRKQKLNSKSKIILLSTSLIFGGIILGGVPNVVLAFQHIFADILYLDLWVLLIIRISIFLALTLVFGRIFCGYVCPAGAAQELASMRRFKSKLDYDKEYKKIKGYLRWIFFGIYIIFSIIWGLEGTLFMNPINGFLIFWTPSNIMIIIAFILLLVIIFASFFIYRPYCRYFCPFGALACLLGKISPLKIRRTTACLECGICEKICPTLEGFKHSLKGECYFCNRCIEFCSNEMFIDTQKLAQIKRHLTTYSMSQVQVSGDNYFDKIIKNLIRLFLPYKRIRSFDEFIDALEGQRDFSVEPIQSIVVRIKELFPDQIQNIDRKKYKEWIENNESKWKEQIDDYQKDKLYYGLAQESV